MKTRQIHVLLMVENAPVPVDRRVWREAQTLKEAGYEVTIVSPVGTRPMTTDRKQRLDGIEIVRFPMPFGGSNKRDFVLEYGWAAIACHWLALRVWFDKPYQVVHVANPPDIFFGLKWLLAWRGVKFIFDQHDLAPELFQSKFNTTRVDLVTKMLSWLERRTYNAADAVIVTNESYRERALVASGKGEHQVFTVRNSPDLEIFQPRLKKPELKQGHHFLVAFAGTMGDQDGVDVLLKAAHHIRTKRGRSDVLFVVMGTGDAVGRLKDLHKKLKLGNGVIFTGFLDDDQMLDYLASADLGAAPDLAGPLNSVSTMVKTMEYMAMGLPVVSFDLKESRVSGAGAAEYVTPETPEAFGDAILKLLDDPKRRATMGEIGRERIEGPLSWKHSTENVLAAYESILQERTVGAEINKRTKQRI